MDYERLQQRITDYLKALHQLERAARQPEDEFIRDSVIQRFEFTYELAWKMLKLRLEAEAIIAATPRQVLQEALQAGFIQDGNAWSQLQSHRNLTSHTYDQTLAQRVYHYIINQGLALFQQLAEAAKTWQTNIQ
ncbi:HI0074 family nucleotidyltransferase substrate-binding subunit [Nitrosomonas sp. Nm34]|uniref:HI0074 family nucleotidyltransferase substrate-binding subunit n=1 Tax=Nitrosomonas sp. Nm34 TaxID=1881055 RepID=UPI0008F35C68|nr:HI0074 family nucleotidyltransferase substrate-binding subunit [Nitrosomonas sp. Nm34]SFI21926.1 nucleotidyltransferase substrate binding protein, HI0074 family [Nitrosomonas sp. Nm34]